MANKDFILQGLTARTHKAAIHDLFDVVDIQRVIVSVAFVNLGGVELLEEKLKTHHAKTTAFIGIRNDVTTIQGARHLFNLGVTLYTVDTGTRRVIYHPKMYVVRGVKQAKLVVGSANLTTGGLNNNIEASIIVECDLDNEADRTLIESIETSFDTAQAKHPDNIVKITTVAQLDTQHEIGLLLDEMAASPPRPASSGTSTSNDTTPRIKLEVDTIFSSITSAKRAAKKTAVKPVAKLAPQADRAVQEEPTQIEKMPELTAEVELELVWKSKELTRRDLDVPTEKGTHRTGSINLGKV